MLPTVEHPNPILFWQPEVHRHRIQFPFFLGSCPWHWQNRVCQVTSPMKFLSLCFSLVLVVTMFSLSCGSDKCCRTFANPGAMTQHWKHCLHYQEQFRQHWQFLRDAARVNPHESTQDPPAKRLKTNSLNSEAVVQVSPANFYCPTPEIYGLCQWIVSGRAECSHICSSTVFFKF